MAKKKNESKEYRDPMGMKDQWEMKVADSVFPKYRDDPQGAFLAGNGSIRPQPHVKVNDCDH